LGGAGGGACGGPEPQGARRAAGPGASPGARPGVSRHGQANLQMRLGHPPADARGSPEDTAEEPRGESARHGDARRSSPPSRVPTCSSVPSSVPPSPSTPRLSSAAESFCTSTTRSRVTSRSHAYSCWVRSRRSAAGPYLLPCLQNCLVQSSPGVCLQLWCLQPWCRSRRGQPAHHKTTCLV
jgi:hypothetical protein